MPPTGNRAITPSKAKFSDLNTAARIKRIIESIAKTQVEKIYPRPRYGTVTAVYSALRRAAVEYPGDDSATFTLKYGSAVPTVGSRVRVAGRAGARYIDDVLTGVDVPASGGSLPAGGTDGQVLTKQSATDGDADWETPSGGGGGAVLEAQFGFGGLVAPTSEAMSAPYMMAGGTTFTQAIVTMSSASASAYTIRIYVDGALADTFTVAAGDGVVGSEHIETVSIVVTTGQVVQASIGAAALATGENVLVVCR